MKKLLTFIIVLFVANSMVAQISVGPRLGVNIASHTYISDDKDIQKDFNDLSGSIVGASFGGVLNIKKDKSKEFQLELLMVQKGESFEIFDEKYKFRTSYLNLKPMWNWGGGDRRGNWFAYGQFGPYVGFWMGAKDVESGTKYEFEDIDTEYKELRHIRFDVGISIGAGFKYKVGPGYIDFNPRFSHGFAPQIIDDMKSYWTANLNRNFSLNFGYLIEL
ncbi:MAG: PorT family protein [Bacteroidetes bacterium]|jgi:hypothetical protein|nr:PorT family protein [Bacteroidota bacterium]MBT6688013.1 PorT family protein [Bacteroidota bacterium]MBT7144823.1 PorT family protein [Bacteroidota bacterium]MBT7492414.1 PorT family protein [Bacteroidota bacterium]